MRACKCFCAAFLAMGLPATDALAAGQPRKVVVLNINADPSAIHPLPVSGGPRGVAALPPTNTCPADDSGVLASAGGSIVGSTVGNTNDFGDAGQSTDGTGMCTGGWGRGGASGPDAITSFQVDAGGLWQFETCQQAVPFDTTLIVTEEDGGGCPGQVIGCNGDGPSAGCPGFTSLLDIQLCAGTTYYLIIDGWSDEDFGDFEVQGGQFPDTGSECPGGTHAECDDGLFCNGVETCKASCDCLPGEGAPCLGMDNSICDEDADVCVGCAGVTDPDAFCADGLFCNGEEFCELSLSLCRRALTPGCLISQTCVEEDDTCVDPNPCVAWLDETRTGSFSPAGANCAEADGDDNVSVAFAEDVELRAGGGRGHSSGGRPPKLLSPQRKRLAVQQAVDGVGVSQRRASQVLRQPRATQRYLQEVREDEALLTRRAKDDHCLLRPLSASSIGLTRPRFFTLRVLVSTNDFLKETTRVACFPGRLLPEVLTTVPSEKT